MPILSRAQDVWDDLRSSLWFVPALMAVGAVVLAIITTTIDGDYADEFQEGFGHYAGGPEGTRAVLETVASSMITVAGVAFSIAIVVMTLASSQYGPRLLRTFMRDFGSQVSLGTFVGMFIFNILVLRTVRSEPDPFVPHLSVTIGILLTLASLGVFIYFIHHAARSIQVAHIIDSVSAGLARMTRDLHPSQIGDDAPAGAEPGAAADRRPVTAEATGYVQLIDGQALIRAASKHDAVVELSVLPGSYVVAGGVLAEVRTAERADDKLIARIRSAIVLGSERIEQQDLGFGYDQLGQMCLRALSPALNDPLTATLCIDAMTAALVALAERAQPAAERADDKGRIRVIARPVTFEAMLETAFGEVRRAARDNVTASLRLLGSLGVISARAERAEDRAAARRMAEQVAAGADEQLGAEDRRRIVHAAREVTAG